jgi:N-acetylglucosamine kinase-like BadF-type ATPase
MTEGYLLGIDTGMSKSIAALCDRDGRLLAKSHGAGVMLFGPPSESQLEVLRTLLDRVCEQAGISKAGIAFVAAGMCGVDFPKDWAEQHAALCSGLALDPAATCLVNDAVVALWGATAASRATIVQQGSAFTSAYRLAIGDEEVFDPFDYARLFDIRREALARLIRMLDGRMERTSLASRLLAHFGVEDLEELYLLLADPTGKGWHLVSTSVPVIRESWQAGDPVALEMVEALASDLAITVRAMASHLGPGEFDAAFGGGVIERLGPSLQDLVAARLTEWCPEARVVGVTLPPEQGALVLAGHQAGLSPTRLFEALAAQTNRSRREGTDHGSL